MVRELACLTRSVSNRNRTIASLILAIVIIISLPRICAAQDAGQVKFVNSCKYSLTFNSTGPQIGTLAAGGQKSIPVASFNQGGQNRIIMVFVPAKNEVDVYGLLN